MSSLQERTIRTYGNYKEGQQLDVKNQPSLLDHGCHFVSSFKRRPSRRQHKTRKASSKEVSFLSIFTSLIAIQI